jgi:predicted 2-oxoglutarate/Fe(II)-dependent dioxygenase YbiX
VPRAPFFAQLGLFMVPKFFDAELCASLRREMTAAPKNPALFVDDENRVGVRDDQRKCDLALVSAATQDRVMARLNEVRPSLEAHFGLTLTGCQPLSFLVYYEGYYFGQHVDNSYREDALPVPRARQVSVSVFLNGEGSADQPDTYGGGALTFHGIFDAATRSAPFGFPLTGEEGLLVGFRSDTYHAVQPVTRGVRYSVVAWFT